MVDNSGLIGGGGAKNLILPRFAPLDKGSTGDFLGQTLYLNSTYVKSPYGIGSGLSIPLFLPKISNAARDFTSTGNFTLGQSSFNDPGAGFPRIAEFQYKDFTIDTGHQLTIPNEHFIILRASGTVTIGGNGITHTATKGGVFLDYPYNHGAFGAGGSISGNGSNGGASAGGGGGGNGSNVGTAGGNQLQYQHTNQEGVNRGGSNGGAGGGAGGYDGGEISGSSGLAGNTCRTGLCIIADTITVNGSITLSGGNGTNGSTVVNNQGSGGGGGGHGGYLFLIANTINYSGGTINVSGGNGGNGGNGNNGGGGGGGGGHCGLIYTHAKTYSGSSTTLTASVGTGGTGGTGTAGDGGDGGNGSYPFNQLSSGEYKIEGAPF